MSNLVEFDPHRTPIWTFWSKKTTFFNSKMLFHQQNVGKNILNCYHLTIKWPINGRFLSNSIKLGRMQSNLIKKIKFDQIRHSNLTFEIRMNSSELTDFLKPELEFQTPGQVDRWKYVLDLGNLNTILIIRISLIEFAHLPAKIALIKLSGAHFGA